MEKSFQPASCQGTWVGFILRGIVALLLIVHLGPPEAFAQHSPSRPWAANVIVPQAYRSSHSASQYVKVDRVDAQVSIVDQLATTQLDIHLANTSQSDQVSELLLPVPDGAVVKSFTFQGQSEEPKTELLTRQQARTTFDSIVAKLKDPALLEFAGYNLLRSSVFPVPAAGTQQVRIVYEHLLKSEGNRVDYVLPRSGSAVYDTPWKINVEITSQNKISTVYSPSHELVTSGTHQKRVTVALDERSVNVPGAFSLSFLREQGPLSATVFSYPNRNGKGGYFLLLASAAGIADDAAKTDSIKREVTLVIDRSGSMSGEKIEQAKEAALQVIEGLEDGEAFNILSYSDEVDAFARQAKIKTKETLEQARKYIQEINARGGTNLHEALSRALQAKPTADTLPLVMFLTDGLPTVGNVSEAEIRKLASDHNPHQRRVFTFGVGLDVNTPLLDKVATLSRAFSTFVLPGQDVETKVSRVFRGLDGPTLAAPELRILDPQGTAKPRRVSHVLPNEIPDLYQDDQIVLLGKYKGKKPLVFEISGNYNGTEQAFTVPFDPGQQENLEHGFVARLWASRRIAALVDQVRDLGAEHHVGVTATNQVQQSLNGPGIAALSAGSDANLAEVSPKLQAQLKELTGEIIALSREFGILTEYTAFLAEEGIDLADEDALLQRGTEVLANRAIACRTGLASVNQEFNNIQQRSQKSVNLGNRYWTSDMKQTKITNVQQCNRNSYFRRGNQWVSSDLVEQASPENEADRVVEFGSPEFLDLVWKLVGQHRQHELALDGEILVQIDQETVLIKRKSE